MRAQTDENQQQSKKLDPTSVSFEFVRLRWLLEASLVASRAPHSFTHRELLPLKPDQIAALGLQDAQNALTAASKGGKPVNFKVYRSVEDVYKYDKTIPFGLYK